MAQVEGFRNSEAGGILGDCRGWPPAAQGRTPWPRPLPGAVGGAHFPAVQGWLRGLPDFRVGVASGTLPTAPLRQDSYIQGLGPGMSQADPSSVDAEAEVSFPVILPQGGPRARAF